MGFGNGKVMKPTMQALHLCRVIESRNNTYQEKEKKRSFLGRLDEVDMLHTFLFIILSKLRFTTTVPHQIEV